jgi:hypothetical protein
MTRARLKVVGMHAGDDADAHDGGQPVVARNPEPRRYRQIARRYGTYLRLLAASLVVGLAVGIGSGWYLVPPATETCKEWTNYESTNMPVTGTTCTGGVMSEKELQTRLNAAHAWMTRSWSRTLTVPVDPGYWLLPAVRNGLIASGVAYLLLILIVVPARMLKRPD